MFITLTENKYLVPRLWSDQQTLVLDSLGLSTSFTCLLAFDHDHEFSKKLCPVDFSRSFFLPALCTISVFQTRMSRDNPVRRPNRDKIYLRNLVKKKTNSVYVQKYGREYSFDVTSF